LLSNINDLSPFLALANEGSHKGRRFLGLLELLRHYQETQIDTDRNLRQAWIFEFRIHRGFKLMPIALAQQLNEAIIKESKQKIRSEERGEVKLADIEEPYLVEQATPVFNLATLEKTRSQLLTVDPLAFEKLIKDAIERNGFYKVELTRRSGDGGIDLNSYLDESHYFLKNTFVQFQAKRWKHSVGRKEIAEFRGSLKSSLGVFVTTSHFTTQAQQESQESGHKPVVLIDGLRFSEIVLRLKVSLTKYLPQ
jgi:restriction system protein